VAWKNGIIKEQGTVRAKERIKVIHGPRSQTQNRKIKKKENEKKIGRSTKDFLLRRKTVFWIWGVWRRGNLTCEGIFKGRVLSQKSHPKIPENQNAKAFGAVRERKQLRRGKIGGQK